METIKKYWNKIINNKFALTLLILLVKNVIIPQLTNWVFKVENPEVQTENTTTDENSPDNID